MAIAQHQGLHYPDRLRRRQSLPTFRKRVHPRREQENSRGIGDQKVRACQQAAQEVMEAVIARLRAPTQTAVKNIQKAPI